MWEREKHSATTGQAVQVHVTDNMYFVNYCATSVRNTHRGTKLHITCPSVNTNLNKPNEGSYFTKHSLQSK